MTIEDGYSWKKLYFNEKINDFFVSIITQAA